MGERMAHHLYVADSNAGIGNGGSGGGRISYAHGRNQRRVGGDARDGTGAERKS